MNTHQHPVPGETAEQAVLIATEERLAIAKQTLETGAVRVRTISHTELREVPVALHSSSVNIERVELGHFVETEFAPRYEGDTLIVPVFEYVPVTELKLVLKEEIRITTVVTTKEDVHTAELQRQEVIVERRAGIDGNWVIDPATPSSGAGESVT